MSVIDWGDVPTWLGAVFAAGAAGAAVWTLASQRAQIREQQEFIAEQTEFMAEQRQNLELERADLRAAAEDRRWAQARQVRMMQQALGGDPDGSGGLVGGPTHWAVTVQNGSDAPVYQLEVRFGSAYTASDAWEWPSYDLVRRASAGDRLAIPVYLLGPRRAVRFSSQEWSPATVHNNRPTLFFTDDNGARWSLNWQGKLEEVPAEPGA